MGQTLGRMPETWAGLLEERDRILHWSSEVLARVQDNVRNEETFLMDYDDSRIDAKVVTWIKTNRTQVDETFDKFPNAPEQLRNVVNTGVEKVIGTSLFQTSTTISSEIFFSQTFGDLLATHLAKILLV